MSAISSTVAWFLSGPSQSVQGLRRIARAAVDPRKESGQSFWLGLWHGIIVPITFIISLFSETVSIYEVHNNGGWYDFGFVIGVGVFLGSGGAGANRARR